jgi:hypothetical protein
MITWCVIYRNGKGILIAETYLEAVNLIRSDLNANGLYTIKQFWVAI